MPDSLRDQLQASLGNAYVLGRELGGGGMSRVFLVHEESLDRDVVVKVLAPGLAQGLSTERFTREIRLVARLQEPHIVPVLTAGTTAEGLPWYTMPYVSGQSLRARMDQGPVVQDEAIRLLRDVARALAYAHAQGIVHRDIKPDNVLLSAGTAVVTDFGIAKAIVASTEAHDALAAPESTLTQAGSSIGTPAYMSPEQATGDAVDHRSDLYAWGVMAYELVGGRHPFVGKSTVQQLIAAHLTEVPATAPLQRPGVPAGLVALVLRCIEKDPARRPQSAAELLAALDAIAPASASLRMPRRPALVGLAIATLLAAGIAIAWAKGRATPHGGEIRSLAVLPFENISGDSADLYLAHGLTNELSVTLGRLPSVRVAPNVSTRVLATRGLGTRDIARALGVQGVLSGTVRRGGDRLRVTAELADGETGARLWSEEFEEPAGEVFAVEDRVTRAIVNALRLELSSGAMPIVARTRGTSDPEAYDLYLRGRYFWSLRSEDGIRRAIDYFNRAAGRDSDYVLAISGLADANAVSAWYSYVPPDEGYGRARRFAQRALHLDSTRAEPHASLGYVALYYDWDWPEAERQFRRAIELDSGYATAYQWFGNYRVVLKQPDDAIALLQRAQRADPLNRVAGGAVCWGQYMLRRYRDAIVQCGRVTELDSTFALARLWSGQSHAMLHDSAAAFRELDQAVRLSSRSGVAVGALAQARAMAGDSARARALLAELTGSGHRYVPSYEVALVHAALGDRDRAMQWLQRAYTERSHSIAFLRTDPGLDPLRADPRFVALLKRLRLD